MSKCFVPKCKSVVGVLFPRDIETRKKWLNGLELFDVEPTKNSFICFNHFHPDDIKNNFTNTRPSNRLKRGAIPCFPNPNENEPDCSESFQQSKDEKQCNISSRNQGTDNICRGCMGSKEVEINIFDILEDDVTICSAFMMCVFPVNISKNDNLPKHMCKTCFGNLKIAYAFQKKCIQTDDILRSNLSENSNKRKAKDEDYCETFKKRSRYEQFSKIMDVGSSENFEFIEDDCLSQDTDDNYEDTDFYKNCTLSNPSNSEINNGATKCSEKMPRFVDEIEKRLDEIHGKSEELCDNSETSRVKTDIIEGEATTEDILNTLEEGNMIVEKDVFNEFLKKKASTLVHTPMVQKKIVVKSNFSSTVNKSASIKEFKLPKGIKIKPVQQYLSKIGNFFSKVRVGLYESNFLQADEYLFEFGLVKGSVRHLRCVIPTCAAQAKQRILEHGEFSMVVEITVPHNHEAPNESTKKKQMFLGVMRKKMQTDRTLNIRHIYEDACLEDPEIKQLVPLRNVINEICRHQLTQKIKPINCFEDFFNAVETDAFEKLHFTHNNQQFYQEKLHVPEDNSMAVVFGNLEVIQQVLESKIMYVDASFKIDTDEEFKYQLVTVLVWVDDSYYPVVFALVNKKSQLIFKKIFTYIRDELAPDLHPLEIITDYEANLYYALAEVYTDSHIGGSVFYYTQNLYKKICSLNLSRDLESNSYFRNIYHMLLMLPLLPVNTINDGLNSIHLEASTFNIQSLTLPLFDHVRNQWILNVTPELFCVHKLENRINENVIAPFKKLRDFLLLTKGKLHKTQVTIIHVIEKIIELEAFLRTTYSRPDKKSFGRDLSSFQKKNVLRAWQFIEDHPKIEINNFFSKVLGYIKCMENQLWIWGFYRYDGDTDDILINASHFSIVSPSDEIEESVEVKYVENIARIDNTIVMDAVVGQDGVLQANEEILVSADDAESSQSQEFETAYIKYIYH